MARFWPGLTILLAVALLVPACGGGGGSGGGSDDTTNEAEGSLPGDDGDGDDGGGSGSGGSDPVALEFRILDAGQMSDVGIARTWTARDASEYDALWNAHRNVGGPTQPAVDFATEIVVAVFLGQKASSGFGAEIAAVGPDGSGAIVRYDEVVPGSNCPPGLPVIISPYAIAAMTRVEGSVTYYGGVREVPCP